MPQLAKPMPVDREAAVEHRLDTLVMLSCNPAARDTLRPYVIAGGLPLPRIS